MRASVSVSRARGPVGERLQRRQALRGELRAERRIGGDHQRRQVFFGVREVAVAEAARGEQRVRGDGAADGPAGVRERQRRPERRRAALGGRAHPAASARAPSASGTRTSASRSIPAPIASSPIRRAMPRGESVGLGGRLGRGRAAALVLRRRDERGHVPRAAARRRRPRRRGRTPRTRAGPGRAGGRAGGGGAGARRRRPTAPRRSPRPTLPRSRRCRRRCPRRARRSRPGRGRPPRRPRRSAATRAGSRAGRRRAGRRGCGPARISPRPRST